MKKINFIILAIFLFLIDFNYVNAKDVLHTCEYFSAKNDLDVSKPYSLSILCEIYTDYTHQCYLDANFSTAKATNQSQKESIGNWTKSYGGVSWNVRDYMKSNNKCPEALLVSVSEKKGIFTTKEQFLIYGAPLEENISEMENYLTKANPNGVYLALNTAESDEQSLAAAEKNLRDSIDKIADIINTYSIDSCLEISDCEKTINSLTTITDSMERLANDYVARKYFLESDQLIQYSRTVIKKSRDFIANSLIEIEKRKTENELVKKDNCTDYTYAQCLNKTDAEGNSCIRDTENNTCKKKMYCTDYKTKNTCPSKSDYGQKCTWNSNTHHCEVNNIMTCPDYLDKSTCKTDENGKTCEWVNGACTYKNVSDDPNYVAGSSNDDIPNICEQSGMLKALQIIGYCIFVAKVLVPLLLILMGCMDFGKIVIASNPNDLPKAARMFGLRLVMGVAIFLLPTIVNFIFGLIPKVTENYDACKTCVFKPTECEIKNDD